MIYYTYEYMQESESFSALGADVAISTGNWVPIVISALIMVVGILLTRAK